MTTLSNNLDHIVDQGKKFSADLSFLGNKFACYGISEELTVKLARPTPLSVGGVLYKYTRISFVTVVIVALIFRESRL
jgi:hypothetical protein